ncbi:MAG: c-type cytochrome biogenesis protein CcsB [Leifsonia sp.]|uniref:C-type cytochrome biogenesis protein CcsB n=3 Tax=Microbacteriaceae TaxID=85023 RepID=A0A9E5MKK7_9MICO|nr:c-type cytochrome biogenesis protein CcsB [Leifsonia sp.]MBU1250498.1 c-type cytochrome biogenesis protein CcsB [Actinomycetota bacterium]NHF63244.1 c-type cytochrome biogenesis protein CcsB [Microcella pacifica]QOD94962.1 c-type cytochrome biogenesis protein CcsB [Chryseoglobus sp. 28M-23]MBU1609254.1 c-type cytochrome biogenesis protein CcsB [Actinomycetota bacterium]
MGVYTVAFILFTLDLAKRSAQRAEPVAARAQQAAVNSSSMTSVLERPVAPLQSGGATRYERAGLALSILGFVLHAAAVLTRGFAAERVPWTNMFEFGLTATVVMMGTFVAVQLWKDLRYLGAYITGFVVLSLGIVTVNFYVDVVPTPPALQSAWLVIHVLVAALATAFFAIGAGLSIMQLMQARREARESAGLRFLDTLPGASVLESLAYRVTVVGFVFWTFTLIAGAIWAERAWGRYWGWDTKEVWTFIIWTLFAGYIHARATRGWRGNRSAWLAIVGFGAVLFNYSIVNLYFNGLHSYSGL